MITFTTRLLRRLHPYLSRDEQIKIATSLQRVVAASLGQDEFTDGVKSTLADTVLLKGVFGVPILKGLEVLRFVVDKSCVEFIFVVNNRNLCA